MFKRIISHDRAIPILIGFIVFFASLPMLASSPQSGDGAEQIMVALQGGVLHPPGFPLQAWLNKIFINLPFGAPAFRLAILSLIAHTFAAFLIADTTRIIGGRALSQFFSALLFSFLPTHWYMGVQPEVFALTHLLIAGLIHQSVRFYFLKSNMPVNKYAVFLGLLIGIAAAQHPITIAAAPAFLFSFFFVLKNSRHRFSSLFVFSIVFITTSVGFYSSLLLMNSGSIWPNWGDLQNLQDVWRHAMRQEYGTFSLAAMSNHKIYWGLTSFCLQILKNWNFALLLLIPAMFYIPRSGHHKIPILILVFSTFTGLILLAASRIDGDRVYTDYILGRFFGPTTIPLAILLGLGLDAFLVKNSRKSIMFSVRLLVVLFCTFLFVHARQQSNASTDNTIDIYHEALSQTFPADAIYLATTDVELAYGVRIQKGHRFPIGTGLLGMPWYRNHVLPSLEPRIQFISTDIFRFFSEAYARNMLIVSTSLETLQSLKLPTQLHGLYFYAQKSITRQVSEETLSDALKLCPFITRLNELPEEGHGFTRGQRRTFARAFQGAAFFLLSTGKKDTSIFANSINENLMKSGNPSVSKTNCQRLGAGTGL